MSTFSMFRRPATIALALTSSIAIVACNPAPTPTPTKTVTSVTATAPVTTLAIGATTQATATVTGTNSPATTVTWSTSNGAVATVSATGLVKAVAAGTAVIKATSTVDTTKSGSFTITVTGAGTVLTTAKINFQTDGAAVPAGYTKNTGAAYVAASGIGWVTEASAGTATLAPLNLTNNARNRVVDGTNVIAGQDARLYTQIQMQCGTNTGGNFCNAPAELMSGAFEHRVVNGKYNVTVSVGDADKRNLNSLHSINVEGAVAIAPFTPTLGNQFKSGTVTVTVTDGSLTIDAKGGKNTKINYVDIVPAP